MRSVKGTRDCIAAFDLPLIAGIADECALVRSHMESSTEYFVRRSAEELIAAETAQSEAVAIIHRQLAAQYSSLAKMYDGVEPPDSAAASPPEGTSEV